jgi:hypothetical protein
MPTREPTVARLIVLTETTRMPASSTGPASGSSTRQNSWRPENPCAEAESRTSSDTEVNASAADRTMIATA